MLPPEPFVALILRLHFQTPDCNDGLLNILVQDVGRVGGGNQGGPGRIALHPRLGAGVGEFIEVRKPGERPPIQLRDPGSHRETEGGK